MGVDYYGVLKVSKTAPEEDLRRAYKKLAMTWHPDKHPATAKALAEAKFKQICEAYDVLCDSQKRQIYDLYGEEGIKSGFYNVSSPSAGAGGGGRRGGAPTRKGSTFFRYNYAKEDEDLFDDFFGVYDSDGVRLSPEKEKTAERKAAPVENMLACSLEELYKGSKRKMKISRIVSDDFGKPQSVEEVLAIDIKPGWKKGTKITFPEKGNQDANLLPGDLIFVIDEKPHLRFQRDGNDLIIHQKLPLIDALTGITLNVSTLDGRNLSIVVSDIVTPGHEIVVQDEGMPISREPKKKGNLIIKFDVKFPSRLSSEQKAHLRRVLGQTY